MSPPIGSARAGLVSQVGDAIPDSGQLQEFDSRDLSLTNTDDVSTWPNGASNDDLSGGTPPEYRTNEINNQPAVYFDRSNGEYLTTSFTDTITQPFDVFVVCRQNDSGSNSDQSPFGSTDVVEATVQADADDFYDTFAGSGISGGTPTADNQLLTWSYDGGSSAIRKNQSDIATGDVGTNSMTATDVGRSANNTGRLFDGPIAYIAWYDASASGYSQLDVEQALVDVFGPF